MSEQDRIRDAVWHSQNERGEFDVDAHTLHIANEVRQRVPRTPQQPKKPLMPANSSQPLPKHG